MMATRVWHKLGVVDMGDSVGTEGIDNAFAERHEHGFDAETMGAGEFGPPGWPDDPECRGWWGDTPPLHTPTVVI